MCIELLERRAQRGEQQGVQRIAARLGERRVNGHVGCHAPGVIAVAERRAHLRNQFVQAALLRIGDVPRRELRALHFDRTTRFDDVRRVHLGGVQRVTEHLREHVRAHRLAGADDGRFRFRECRARLACGTPRARCRG